MSSPTPTGEADDTEMSSSASISAPAASSSSQPADSSSSSKQRTITVTDKSGRKYTYDYDRYHEELRRPKDIIRRIEHDERLNLSGLALASHDLTTDGSVFADHNADIDYDEHPALQFYFKPQPLRIHVLHCGEKVEPKGVTAETTVRQLRELLADIGTYNSAVRVDDGRFTFNGSRITDEHRTLQDIGLRPGTLYRDEEEDGEFDYDNLNWSSIIEGKLQLRITDPNLPQAEGSTLPAEVLVQVYSDDTLFELIEQYVKATNRTILHMEYSLIPQGDTMPLDMSQPLHQQHIVDDMYLTLNTKKMKVIVKEAISANDRSGFEYTDLELHDWESVRDIKHAYNAAKAGEREPLTTSDTLFFASDVLDDHRRLFSYKIQNASEIQLQRESLVRKVAVYICASCGHDVTLKRNDQIQCLNCLDNHILYKKPTGKPRQYICR